MEILVTHRGFDTLVSRIWTALANLWDKSRGVAPVGEDGGAGREGRRWLSEMSTHSTPHRTNERTKRSSSSPPHSVPVSVPVPVPVHMIHDTYENSKRFGIKSNENSRFLL